MYFKKQNCFRTPKIHKSTQKIFFYVPNNNFSYTQPSFLFLLQKSFDICLEPFLLSSSSLHVLLFEAFICVFDSSYLPFLYILNENYKKIWLVFFKFSSSEFPLPEFSLSESEEISISSIYLGIFFSLIIFLHSSKKHLKIIIFTCSKSRIDQDYW